MNPMYRAQYGGERRHVLALSRVELVVLLALIEALFAPGWEHKDGRTTPAGMLAARTGRGAATDRLGLLPMVLFSHSKGWLQLCSGSADSERGRPAATVARLLGCSPAAGAKVLSRLQEQDVLSVDRRETVSGLHSRSRVRLLPVAKANGIAVREAREAADAVFSDLAGTASGDHEAAGEAVAAVVKGFRVPGRAWRAIRQTAPMPYTFTPLTLLWSLRSVRLSSLVGCPAKAVVGTLVGRTARVCARTARFAGNIGRNPRRSARSVAAGRWPAPRCGSWTVRSRAGSRGGGGLCRRRICGPSWPRSIWCGRGWSVRLPAGSWRPLPVAS